MVWLSENNRAKSIRVATREETVALPDEVATAALAARLAKELQAPATVFLRGDLGVGKTTFTRYFLRACGVSGAVKSPTYTLLEPYQLDDGPFYHFDLYRINDPWELELAGFGELFDEHALRFVEWPERGAGWLPSAQLELEFAPGAHESERQIRLRWFAGA